MPHFVIVFFKSTSSLSRVIAIVPISKMSDEVCLSDSYQITHLSS